MRVVRQVTHNDLDGYGAACVATRRCAVVEVEHVMRYSDVEAVMGRRLAALAGAPAPETLLVTDVGVERALATAGRAFARLPATPGGRHRLMVLDHHASSVDVLGRMGYLSLDRDAVAGVTDAAIVFRAPEAQWDGDVPDVLFVVDPSRCATTLAHELGNLYARDAAPSGHVGDEGAARALVPAVDAIDLWRPEDPCFNAGCVLNDAFWEVVGTVIPVGHPRHDDFVLPFLLDLALEPEDAEEAVPTVRRKALERVFHEAGYREDPWKADFETLRMRAARFLALGEGMFAEGPDGIAVCHAVDVGIFQRVSDHLLRAGRARVAVDVLRGGSMSVRSRDGGSALAFARAFRGGGHPDAAGARLTRVDPVLTLEEAMDRIRAGLEEAEAEGRR